MFIFDEKIVLLGSTNLSWKSILKNNETNVLVKNESIAKYYKEYFLQLWKDSSKDPVLEKLVLKNAEPVVSRNYYPFVLNLLKKSNDYIDIYMYGLRFDKSKTNPIYNLLNEIINAQKRGVKVRMVIEKSDKPGLLDKFNSEVADYLKENDIIVRYDPENIISHSKLLIVDGTVILGSTNWGYGAMNQYNEANIALQIKPITKFFRKYFKKLWENEKE